MRRIMFVAACLLVSAAAFASDADVEALRQRLADQDARMAAQDARLNDLQAKIVSERYGGGAVEGVTSIQKNAKVTIGGLVTTRYAFQRAKIDSAVDLNEQPKPYGRTASAKLGDLFINDAEISMQIDVNEHFDAFVTMDLHNGAGEDYNVAKVYYVRWKDICNSGFGLKVGRDHLVFGEDGVGELASYAAGSGDGLGEIDFGIGESLIMPHNGWDIDGVVQVTPYWEGLDGKLSAELSFIQNVYNDGPRMGLNPDNGSMFIRQTSTGELKYRSRNYGIGSMSGRVIFTPFEDLRLTASVVNYRSNGRDDYYDFMHARNNTAMALSFNYNPCYFNKLNIWTQWVRGWNVDNMDGYRSDAVNFGASYDVTDNLTVFAQGDYMRGRVSFSEMDYRFKGKAWAAYVGGMYDFGDGISLEAGWKREWETLKEGGITSIKARCDTIYAQLGFEF